MNNTLQQLLQQKKNKLLNLFYTAGYPYLTATTDVLNAIQTTVCDIVEIGIPFSDPLSDGPTIQNSSRIALENGMNIETLFQQLKHNTTKTKTPIILMGYLNPVMQYGIKKFLQQCQNVGVAGTIFPDLPIDIYEQEYQHLYQQYHVSNIFLVTPETTQQRILKIDALSNSFIYVLSASATTGKTVQLEQQQLFFQRLNKMKLKNHYLIGFGIRSKDDFTMATTYANGAIIGSAFVEHIKNANTKTITKKVQQFVTQILD